MFVPFAEVLSVDPFSGASGPGRNSAFLVLVSFLVAFAFIRTSARMSRSPRFTWWPGSVTTESGLHLHHLVWGISLMLIAGFGAFALTPSTPWWQIVAVLFGFGAGLTLDEFALWIHLDDVYWSDEGRISIDAVVITAMFMALVVIGTKPFGLDEPASEIGTAVIVLQALVLAVIAFAKGRIGLGALTLFIPFFGLWAAVRLARPGSPWAHRFYVGSRAEKLERSRARFTVDSRGARWRRDMLDAIGGRPSEPDPPRA